MVAKENPLPYEKVIRSTPCNEALEYLIYHAFIKQVTPRDLERRIHELEQDLSRKNGRYNKAVTYYLKHKLAELVLGGD